MPNLAQVQTIENPDNRVRIVKIIGQMDETNLPEASTVLDEIVTTEGVEIVILDLTELEFLNSKVIGYLADLHSRMDEAEKRLVMVGVSESVNDILELVGLTALISSYPDTDSALSDLLS